MSFKNISAGMRSAAGRSAGSACKVSASGSCHTFGQLPPPLPFEVFNQGVIKIHCIGLQYGQLQISATRLLCGRVQKKSKKLKEHRNSINMYFLKCTVVVLLLKILFPMKSDFEVYPPL